MDYLTRKRTLERKEFFSSSFRNQEIYYAGLDAITDGEVFKAKLAVVDACLAGLVHREVLIVHLEETPFPAVRRTQICGMLELRQDKLKKLAVVGAHGLEAWLFGLALKKRKLSVGLGWRMLDDLQVAKEWITRGR